MFHLFLAIILYVTCLILAVSYSERFGRHSMASQYFLQLADSVRLPVISWNADNSAFGSSGIDKLYDHVLNHVACSRVQQVKTRRRDFVVFPRAKHVNISTLSIRGLFAKLRRRSCHLIHSVETVTTPVGADDKASMLRDAQPPPEIRMVQIRRYNGKNRRP